MCNLYDLGPSRGKRLDTEWERIAFRGMSEFGGKPFGIRKTDPGLVLLSTAQWEAMRWGFSRPFNPAINNARSDKLAGGMWIQSWEARQRCVIPVSAYYEWSGGPPGKKQTYAFQPEGDPGHWLWAAGIWEDSPQWGSCYSMVTTEGSAKTSVIHDRMPALLAETDLEEFLESEDPRELLRPSHALIFSPCENPLKNPRHDGPVLTPMLPGFE